MESQRPYQSLGVQIYADDHSVETRDEIETLLELAESAVYPIRFSHVITGNTAGVPRRVKPIKDFQSLTDAWVKPAFCSVLHIESNAMNDFLDLSESVARFGLRRALSRSENGGLPGYPMHFGCVRSGPTSDVDAEAFVNRAVDMFNTSRGRVGLIHSATQHRLMLIEVGVACSNPMIPHTIEHTADRAERIGWERRDVVGLLAPGAYWGMMLGESMVERLGGLERIERQAPVHSTRRLEHGAILLRATAKPVPLTDPELQARLPDLESYIDPIAVPIGPYFREILGRV